ncbi:hypothetical protein Q1695_002503 [Nippostrongylus brasiliensis]|nr:hypothetical protein Q1695_002503 [Nippostrongylus brasiliensis]
MGETEGQWPAGKPEPTSKQFQPKKYKDGGQEWRRERRDSANQHTYAYTPFKANSLSRANTPLASISEQSSHNGSLRKPIKPHPFQYPNQMPQRHQTHEPPQSHSTPKATHHSQIRPGSAAQMTKEQKLTWGRLPPPSSYRSASAMGQPVRPASRQSETGIGHCVGSRYQSYCTLPRPEEVDVETLSEMHSNLHAFYPNGAPKVVSRPPSVATIVPGMPNGPGMASDFIRPPSAFRQNIVAAPLKPNAERKEMVSWNTLSLLSSMQVLCSLAIFGIGVGRMLEGAKWAIGVELAYALLVMISGLAGIYAVRQRSYAAAAFVFGVTGLSLLLAIPPLTMGLFPTIPWAFSEATPSTWINQREPLELDFGLSLVVLIQVLISLVICISGCRSVGVLCGLVEETKLHRDLHSAFHDMEIPHKA